ncbi:MAG: PD-(D/E)XK nuclease family transposase [Tannerella sp.]|nr:PD-(D/E)XK nuclease family transposase [Tannerella sp.]
MKKINYIRFDWAIKRLLRQKANYDILEGFLSTVLNEDIRIKRILDEEGKIDSVDDRINRIGLLAENSAGELYIIEVQNNREPDFFHRVLCGITKGVTDYISEGNAYGRVKKLYCINIIYFELGLGKDCVYHGHTKFRGIHGNDVLWLTESSRKQLVCEAVGDVCPEYYFLRVDNFDKKTPVTQPDEWIYFLKTSEIPETAKAKGLPEARERLRVDKMSDSDRATYNAHVEAQRYQRSVIKTGRIEGLEEGEAIGLEKGEKIGLEKGKKIGQEKTFVEIVQNAHRNGLTVEQIRAITQLDEEQIRKIIES